MSKYIPGNQKHLTLNDNINSIYTMIDSLSEEELFKPHMRKWKKIVL